jgi:hypothetical protein
MRNSAAPAILVAGALLLGACRAGSPSPSPGSLLTESGAKYAVLAELGVLWYCDPDFYPIEVRPEQDAALERWPEVIADGEVFAAILEHLGWDADRDFHDADKLAAYREWKVLRAIVLVPLGDDGWAFDVLTLPRHDAQAGFHSRGSVSERGVVRIALQEASTGPACPICLARGTLIDTPAGPVRVELLRESDAVWTKDAAGQRAPGLIQAVGAMVAPAEHRVVHIALADGRQAWVSPGHPTTDGRRVGEVRPGDELDGSRVVSAELEAYGGGTTFDLLPTGATGAYWANGILLGSTLSR